MKKYDIVVVGAGNAGLAASLHAAQAGKKVLLIEQHNLPGGCASGFRRGRFEIEPSLHELCDVGPLDNPGDVRTLLEGYGVNNIEWIRCPDCFRVVSRYSDGSVMDVTMPEGIEPFKDAMEKYVPGCRAKMDELFELFDEVLSGIGYISASNGHADSNVLKEKYPNLLRTGAYPTKKVFEAMKIPQKAQDILSTYWAYLGVDMEHLAFIHYAAMVHKYVSRGAYIPAHTSHEISLKMLERFREMGGECWFNCRAEQFLFDGDRCCGVKTNMGEISCDYVLANINSDIVYGRMVPAEVVPDRLKKLSTARKQNHSARMFTAYFCCDVPYQELGITHYNTFLMGTADSRKEYLGMTDGFDSNEYGIFLCYNVANPKASPEGTCICSLTTMGVPADWDDLPMEQYVPLKEKFVRKMLKSVKEKMGVDLTGHIEECVTASPWTFARYLGTPEGSVYGHEAADWDGMMPRLMMLSSDYPVKGLRTMGADGPRGDGYSAAYICGQLMAKLALKDLSEGGK